MKLTAKQEMFCQFLANGDSQADAYRKAYNADDMTANSVYVKASELMANGKVTVRVAELKEAIERRNMWSRERSVEALAQIAQDSETRAADKVSAIKELNSMHGFNAPAKAIVEHSFPREIVIVAGRAEG